MNKVKEPITFYLASPNIIKGSFKLPDGTSVFFNRGTTYTTSEPEVIDFLSKQTGLGIKKMNDKEFRVWYNRTFDELPTVFNDNYKREIDVEEFIWTSDSEKRIAQKLRDRGYLVSKEEKVISTEE